MVENYNSDGENIEKQLISDDEEIIVDNADLVFMPKFIPYYPKLQELGLDNNEILIFGFIDFYLSFGKKFYYSNKKLAKLLNLGETKISLGITKLQSKGLFNLNYKTKANGGKIRFISYDLGKTQVGIGTEQNKEIPLDLVGKNTTFIKQKSDLGKSKGIYNNIIKNNNIIIKKEIEYYSFVKDFLNLENAQIKYQIEKQGEENYLMKQYAEIDKLEKDGYSVEAIQTVLLFIKQHDFWSKNILSVSKLRQKNKDGVPYIVVMISAIQNWTPPQKKSTQF